MNVQLDLHMSQGDGETSYATNSRLQEKSILLTRPVLHKAVAAAHASLSPTAGTMVVADLGCSSGPNMFLVVSEVLAAIVAAQRKKLLEDRPPVQVQFFLNDLPSNDFNLVFQSLEMFKELADTEKGEAAMPPYYVTGLPGSFYGRLFPDHSVHLFHSSYCLMWRSKVPAELSRSSIALNEGNIYISETTPPSLVKMYRKQFEEDFSLFLGLRHSELVSGGHMVLTFLGSKNNDVVRGEVSLTWALLSQSLQSLVGQGRVEKEKLDSFNLPFYSPSVDEVKEVISRSELFDVNHMDLLESNLDPHDDLDDDLVVDSARSGVSVVKCIRAVVEPLVTHHFGGHIIDGLFEIFTQNVAMHLQKMKTKYPVIVLSLQAKRAPKYPANDSRYTVFAPSQLI